MTIEITGPFETPASDLQDALQQNGVQAQEQEQEAALVFTAAPGVRRKQHRWVAPLSRIFVAAKESRSTRRPYRPSTAYLERARMACATERR
jgi:hypothetical protein